MLLNFSSLLYCAGPRWGRYYVGPIQFMVCYGAVIACTLLGGQCMKVSSAPISPTFFFFFSIFKASTCISYSQIVEILKKFSNLAGNLLAIRTKWEYEALRIRDYIWFLDADFSSNPIFSLTKAY